MPDVTFAEVKPEEYLGIFFSGGRAPEYIRYDEDLILGRRVRWDPEREEFLGDPAAGHMLQRPMRSPWHI